MLSGRAASCSTHLAQEHAAEKRSCGRPRPGWVGPRWKTKNNDQPENHHHKRYFALRMSWPPRKSGKKKAHRKMTSKDAQCLSQQMSQNSRATIAGSRRLYHKACIRLSKCACGKTDGDAAPPNQKYIQKSPAGTVRPRS